MQVCAKDAGFPFRPESVTDALLIHCGEKAAIAFLATELRSDGKWHNCGVAVFRSSSVLQVRYGYPNDEAFRGHKLYEMGLKDIDIAEIENSDWLRDVIAINTKVFPDSKADFSGVLHYIFPFKESTLEVLWRQYEFEISDKSYQEIGKMLSSWVSRY